MTTDTNKINEAIESQIAELENKIAGHEQQKQFYQTKAIAFDKKGEGETACDYFKKAAIETASIIAYNNALAMFRMLKSQIN